MFPLTLHMSFGIHTSQCKLLLLHLFLTFFLQDMGCAMIEAVNCQPITWKPDLRPFHVGCVVDKMALGHSEYFGFPLSSSFHQYSILIPSSITDAKKSWQLIATLHNTYHFCETIPYLLFPSSFEFSF